jgi:rfaE bifunctional protein kinase chain/domain
MGTGTGSELLLELLRQTGLTDRGLIRDPERPTTIKTRILAQDQQLLRIDEESTADLTPALTTELLNRVEGILSHRKYDVLVLQDYNKGVLTDRSISGLLDLANRYRLRVVVDPKRDNFWAYRGVDLFKPNLREMRQQLDFPLRPELGDLDRAAAECFSRLACRAVMITLSEHGIYTHDGQQSAIHPTRARRIIDVSGAGDTVISVAAGGVGAGMSTGTIARLANLAGAQVIAKPGVIAVDREELAAEWMNGG